jgi:hypothetical protein
MTIYGLVGYPRSGKDAIAEHLVERHGYVRIAFGDGVKSLLLATDPEYQDSLQQLEACKAAGTKSTREKLQNLGEVLRKFDQDFWVKAVRDKIKDLPGDAKVIITDIRYQNEFHMVEDMGGEVVGIQRPGFGPVNQHESEVNTGVLLEHARRLIKNDSDISSAANSLLQADFA